MNYLNKIDQLKIRRAERILRLLGGERTSLVIKILNREHYISVNDITELATKESDRKFSQPEVSKILGDLKRYGIADSERHGKYVFYSLDHEFLKKLVNKVYAIT